MSIARRFKAAAAFTISLALGVIGLGPLVGAAEITVLSSNVFTGVLDELTVEFERSSGHKVTILYGTAGAIRTRVQAGEFGDLTILPRPMLDELLRQGRFVSGAIVDMAHSAVGVAIRKGSPNPDISSVEAFRRSLLAAQTISYADPARGGATGVLVVRILERLGLTESMKSKTKLPPPGHFAVELVAKGEAEIALAQPMEVLGETDLALVGLLPAELQDSPNFVFSLGLLTDAKEAQAARDLIKFLSGPAAAAVLKAKGMEPGSSG